MNFEQIWSKYKHALGGYIQARISNDADAEDLLQEVLLKTYQNLEKIDSLENVKSWLYTVTKNAIIDYYRKHGKVMPIEFSEELLVEEEKDEIYTPLSQCIIPFINALPDESRILIKAIDIEGKNQKQIAQEKGIPYSTLKSQVQKGRKDLRVLFEACCSFSYSKKGNLTDFEEKTKSCKKC